MSPQKIHRTEWLRPGMLVGLSLLGAWSAHAAVSPVDQNWRQWRGPLGTGFSPTAEPPVTWSEGKNIRWKVKLPGNGSGAPVVWNDRIYVQTAVPASGAAAAPPAATGAGGPPRTIQPTGPYRFMLLCLDRRTGKTIWQKVAREEAPHEGHHADHGYSSQSAVTDGKHVYAYFGSRGLYAYDLKGNLKWSKNLGRMQTRNGFGEGSTPALHGNALVVTWDHEGDDFIVALNATTGKELWRQKRDEPTSWATPLIVQHGKQTQVVTAASNRVRSYDLASGKVIWECSGLTGNVIPTPVAANGVVYVTSGFRGSALMAIRLGRAGDLTGTDAILWSHNRATPYVPSPLLYGDRLYFFGSNNGILSCFDVKTGRPLLNGERIQALQGVYASPVGAAGRVYLVGRNGATVVIKRSDKLDVLATNHLAEGVDASPALSGKDLFVRGREHLYCISEK
jgi:outer membrane protein assembly factor BamB